MDLHSSLGPAADFDGSQQFQYSTLAADTFEIRLINLTKPVRLDEPVCLDLVPTALKSKPRYLALSYTWGRPADNFPEQWDDPSFVRTISVNGCRFDVRPNLFFALQVLRANFKENTILWIDAISINQVDVDEKNAQIRRMNEVYSNSAGVLVWLGPDDYLLPSAFFKVKAVSDSWLRRPNSLQEHKLSTPAFVEYREFVDEEFGDEDTLQLWDAVRVLMARHWWQRAWIVQETCLGRCVVFFGESRYLSWTEILNFQSVVLQHIFTLKNTIKEGLELEQKFMRILCTSTLQPLQNIENLIKEYHQSLQENSKPHLLTVLMHLRRTHATDDRDKIYAGLGMAKQIDSLEVDYSLPTANVYIRTAVSIIKETDSLGLLGFCHYPPVTPGLPTWVPDWKDASLNIIPLPKREYSVFGTRASEFVYFAGGKSETIDAIYHETVSVLAVRGALLDSFAFVAAGGLETIESDPMTHPGGTMDSRILIEDKRREDELNRDLDKIYKCTWLHEWAQDQSVHDKQYPVIQSNGWSHTPSAGAEQFETPLYRPTGEHLREAYLVTLTTDIYQDQQNGCEKRRYSPDDSPARLDSPTLRLGGRTFAVTNHGITCLVPKEAKIGDALAIVQGSEVPFVLRHSDRGGLLLIGECYAHGFMDGEAYQMLKEAGQLKMLPLI